jgi:general secretion pathway protein E
MQPLTKPLDETEEFEARLGQGLIQRGKLDRAGLERAIRVRAARGDRLDHILSKLGLVADRDIAEAVAEQLGLGLVTAQDYPMSPILEEVLGPRFLKEVSVLPLDDGPDGLALAMADPLNDYAVDAVHLISGRRVVRWVAIPAELENATSAIEEVGEAVDSAVEQDVERLKDLASEAPVIRLVNNLITRAVEMRASDIHIEPFENKLRIRYRIDGAVREMDPPAHRYRAAIISRLKIMAKLNIAERRLPQDGRIKLAIRGTPIDLRVVTIPTLHGESVIIRILDRASVALDFATLGFDGRNFETFLDMLEQPHGVLLVTGPTGSGKTTTLYTSLVRLNTPDKKILTVEDPIEYQLDGINQIQVKPDIGLNFANVLRSILRADPDIIMIGEIRDAETAEIAVQAALTGHLVLSTVHTNNAVSTVTRLLDMGVEDYLLTSTLTGVAAQRLVRTLCPGCRGAYRALPELVEQMHLQRYTDASEIVLYRATGCDSCNGTGYYGRTCVFETLAVTDTVRRLILQHAESTKLNLAAIEDGMQTMYDDGMAKALAGITTLEEVLRVTRDV